MSYWYRRALCGWVSEELMRRLHQNAAARLETAAPVVVTTHHTDPATAPLVARATTSPLQDPLLVF